MIAVAAAGLISMLMGSLCIEGLLIISRKE